MKFLQPQFITRWTAIIKEKGWKGFIKEHGWKVFAAIVAFYLIRDTILYIIIPYLVINNMITCQ